MKASSLKEIQTELGFMHPRHLQELCLRMVKFRKENKELLTYLLFKAHDEQAFILEVRTEIDGLFNDVNKSSLYLAKKTIRKILRTANKYIKYSGSRQTEVEIRIHFCRKLKASGISLMANSVTGNIYASQIKKIKNAMAFLHEDLQYDYAEELRQFTRFP